jgi:hypothetical protein
LTDISGYTSIKYLTPSSALRTVGTLYTRDQLGNLEDDAGMDLGDREMDVDDMDSDTD